MMARWIVFHAFLVVRALALVLMLLTSVPAWAEVEDVERLLAELGTGTEGSRYRAASRLFNLGENERGVTQLIPQLRHDDPGERALAARLLGLLRCESAASALVTALGDDDPAVRHDAAEALGQIGARASASALEALLEDTEPRVRIAAIRSLGELGRRGRLPGALERETVAEVRLHLIETLGHDGSTASRRALLRALLDDLESVRTLAAVYLVELGEARGVVALRERMESSSTTVRLETIEALGRATGSAAEPARRVLLTTLEDPEPLVGLAAAAVLAAAGDSRGSAHLRRVAMGHDQAAVRARALELLDELSRSE